MKYPFHLILLLFLTPLLMQCSTNETASENTHQDPDIDFLPEMKLVTMQGDTITDKEFPQDIRLVFVFFSPECEHCQHEMETFPDEVKDLKNAMVILVSPYDSLLVKNFAVKYKLLSNPKIMVLLDPLHEFDRKLIPDQTPIIYLFNEEHQFVGVMRKNRNAKGINKTFEEFKKDSTS